MTVEQVDVLVIGGDAAGMSAASQVRRRRPEATLVVLERGEFISYAACGMPYYLAGDIHDRDELVVLTAALAREKRGIDVRLNCEATAIDTAARQVEVVCAGQRQKVGYGDLLIATGAEPVVPPWPGVDLRGVLPLRNLVDLAQVEDAMAGARHAVIVGAGYVGLEVAEALLRRGLDVTVVEKQPFAAGIRDADLAEAIAARLDEAGGRLCFETAVQGFEGREGRLTAVVTDNGALPADLAIVALGVRPRAGLAAAAGIPTGVRGAIAVDRAQRTPVAGVWAAGDCAETWHRLRQGPDWIPLALNANRAGRIAGANIAGGNEVFPGTLGTAATKVFDLVIARTGLMPHDAPEQQEWQVTTRSAPSRAHYFPGAVPVRVNLVHDAQGRLFGAWMWGRDHSIGKRIDTLAVALSAGLDIRGLSELDLAYAPPFAPVWDPVVQAANSALLRLQSSSTAT